MCIFCKIINNEIPSAKVYEDDKILAFLDINPVTDGHTLIIPKQHYENMENTPDELAAHIFQTAKKLMPKIKQAMRADFICVSVVGLDVPHFHVHLVPRRHDDGLANFWPTKKYGVGEMEKIKSEIVKLLNC